LEAFPDLGYMGGDFDCPSSHWDTTVLHEHPMATRSMECATFLNMERVALPSGWDTCLLYNAVLCGPILNLVFLLIYWGYTANLMIVDKGKPNHFPLLLDVPLKVFWLEGKMSIKANSEEEADFLGNDEHGCAQQHRITFWTRFKLTQTLSFDMCLPTEG
jgi:hypothetical protein